MSKSGGFHLWPRSLYGQILLVVAAALLVAQGINAAMLLAGGRVRAVVEASTMVVSRVVNQVERSREFGLPLDHEARRYAKEAKPSRFRQNFTPILVGPSPLSAPAFEPQSEMTERANEFLAQTDTGLKDARLSLGRIDALPNPLREALTRRPSISQMNRPEPNRSQEAIMLSVQTADGRWITTATKVRPISAESKWPLLIQTLLLYIAVMIPLALVARRISRPLRQLTSRVQRVGLTDEIAPLASEGPEDIRQLIDSFNAMQSRVSSLLGEKDVMLGAIGHDLKTPLAALRVRIESVEDDTEREKMATTIDEMVTILDDILTLARLGRSGEAPQRTDLDALVQSVVEEFEDAGKQVNFAAVDQRHVATFRPVLLRRALRNLISNALLYGKQADVHIEQASGRLRICIDDNGPGIPQDQIESMFEPFARAEKARNRATGGTGLGLTIARAIARSHDGDVKLENRAEGGLRAILELRLSE